MIIKDLFIFLLLVAAFLTINQSIKRYAESQITYLQIQLKLLEAVEELLQVYSDIKPYTTELPILKDSINKKLDIYKSLSKYGLLTPFYNFFYD